MSLAQGRTLPRQAAHKSNRVAYRISKRVMKPTCAAAATPKSAALSPEVAARLKRAEAFCFDVDSTFCEDESIDELAAFLGVGEQVAEMTRSAMGGTTEFKDALTKRLGIMQPSSQALKKFLESHPPRVSPGIPELLAQLRKNGQQIFLVSGGFRQIINPIAASLDIPLSHVFANTILFGESGAYAGFDETEFTCRSGGKPAAIRHIKDKFKLGSVVMVGDGATDLEARLEGAADLFIGYGGVVARQNIADKADWYIMEIKQLTQELQ